MYTVHVCILFRFGDSAILPDRAFLTLEALIASLQNEYLMNFQYNGATNFNERNECVICADEGRHFVFVAKRLILEL
jgi:hypothetical protein